jgi:hypothetical protein
VGEKLTLEPDLLLFREDWVSSQQFFLKISNFSTNDYPLLQCDLFAFYDYFGEVDQLPVCFDEISILVGLGIEEDDSHDGNERKREMKEAEWLIEKFTHEN